MEENTKEVKSIINIIQKEMQLLGFMEKVSIKLTTKKLMDMEMNQINYGNKTIMITKMIVIIKELRQQTISPNHRLMQ